MSPRERRGGGLVVVVLVVHALGLGMQSAVAGGLPDYATESQFLVDTPGTTLSITGGLYNPAAWAIQHHGGLFLGWTDAAGSLSNNDYTGVLSFRSLAFGIQQFNRESLPGDAYRIRDYQIGISVGSLAHAWGLSYGWGGGDLDRQPRHERFTLGSVTRFRPVSLGIAWTRDLEVTDNYLQADLGIRPLGPRFTLFGDAEYQYGQSFADIVSGYGLEMCPFAGLRIAAKARSTGDLSLRVDLALGSYTDWSARPQLNDAGDRSAVTYALEIAGPIPSIDQIRVRGARRYPTLDLNGRMAYQRHRWFDNRKTLLDELRRIQHIGDDPYAGGVVVNLSGAEIGTEMMWELREQLAGLRARGKRVIVYFDRAGMSGYMLASVADEVWMDPVGLLDVRGVALGRTYMMHTLEKLGLGFDEWRFFTYKSAFETYARDSMSEPDREQRQELVNDLYEDMAITITTARGLTRAAWDSVVDTNGILLPDEARAAGLVDAVGTIDQARASARSGGHRRTPDVSGAVLAGVTGDHLWSPLEWGRPPRIAVLYAIGPCEMDEGIRGRTLSKEIGKARQDHGVAAVVLRVDSPGGDILPSDLVAREILATSKVKPVIVSQGGVAASGGYWISMFADTVVAGPMTITGSIGVIGGWVWNNGFGDKIGFDFDQVKHGAHADAQLGIRLPIIGETIPDRPLTADERQRIETLIRAGYEDFVDKVARGRRLDTKYVDSIAQGRVWSGTRGAKNGLVDELGGLWRALQIAKASARIPPDRQIELVEGPEIAPVDFRNLFKPELPSLASREAEAQLPLTEDEIDYLRHILRARGGPVYMMEPFQIEDGSKQGMR